MDDFLGTSIQYSELQIKLLEKEHYENQQKIVEDLINSGFLDSDYEEESTETESTDNELNINDNELNEASLEIKENDNMNESESPLIESIDDSKMNISPKSLDESDSSSTSIDDINNVNDNNLNMVLSSDISVVDELNVSNSESINDAIINNQIIDNNNNMDNEYKAHEYEHEYQHENEYDSDDQIQGIQQFDIATSKSIVRFMEFVFSDIKCLMILFVLMIAMPHIIDHAHHHENDNDDMQQFCGGGVKYQSHSGYRGYRGHNQYHQEASIYWRLEPYHSTTTHSIVNDEDDERDEYQNDDEDDTQCVKKEHILSFDIITKTLDTHTNKVRGAKILHREFKIPSDLCNNNGPNHNMNMNMKMKNIPIPRGMPRLFMNIGGLSSMRTFKSTSIASVGRHFGRTQGIYALVMAFVGIAGFAASNNIDEIMSITISS